MMMKLLLMILLLVGGADDEALTDINEHYLTASYYLQNQKPQLALAELEKAIEADPQSAHLHLALGKVHIALNNVPAALLSFEKAAELNPENAEAARSIGKLLIQRLASDSENQELIAKVERMLTRASELDPYDVESRWYLALLYEHKGDQERQYEILKSAAEIDPNSPNILQRTAEVAEEIGDVRTANIFYSRISDLLVKYIGRRPDDISIHRQLADLSLWDTRKFDVALKSFDKIIELANTESRYEPLKLEAEIGKATAYYFMEDYMPALALFTKNESIVLQNFSRSIPMLLLTYAHAEYSERALNILASLSTTANTDNEGLVSYLARLKAAVYTNAENWQKAQELYGLEITRNPENIESYLQLSQVFVNDKDFAKASEILDQAERLKGKDDIDVLFMRSVIEERSGNDTKALEYLQKIIAIDPENHMALNYAGYTMADAGKNLELARDYLLRALELEPNQGSYLDSIGWVYFQMGDYATAEQYLCEAVKTKYKSSEVREHLGYLHLALNRKDKALREFEAAIENNLAEVKPIDKIEKHIQELRSELEINQ